MIRHERYEGAPIPPTDIKGESIDGRLELVEAIFITLRSGLRQLQLSANKEFIDQDTPRLDLEKMITSDCRSYWIGQTVLAIASNGCMLQKSTKDVLYNTIHRLTVPTDGSDPVYKTRPYNIDIQAMVSSRTFTGYKDISKDPNAVVELLSFERDVVNASIPGGYWCIIDNAKKGEFHKRPHDYPEALILHSN